MAEKERYRIGRPRSKTCPRRHTLFDKTPRHRELHRDLIDAETTLAGQRVVTAYGLAVFNFIKLKFPGARFPGIFLNNYSTKHLRPTASERDYTNVSLAQNCYFVEQVVVAIPKKMISLHNAPDTDTKITLKS